MPTQKCQSKGKSGYRWGQSGKCFTGRDAKARAARQGRAIEASIAASNCDCREVENVRRKPVPSNPLKADPSRTKTLRGALEREFHKRFNRIKHDIFALLVTEDAFGLRPRNQTTRAVTDNATIENQRFRFLSTPEQIVAFQEWLKTQTNAIVLGGATPGNVDNVYWQRFVEEGYRKGQGRAFVDVRPVAAATTDPKALAFFEGTKAEFLRSSFGSPVAVDKVKILAGRVFTELQGVNVAMAQGITRELTEGLARGENPHTIARRMQDTVEGIGKRRATLIARTEIIRAHAEGQLDAMESLGVEKVGVAVEWSTAGDDRVCFPVDTMILTEHGEVPIQNIVIGMLVETRQGLQRVLATQAKEHVGNFIALEIQQEYVKEVKDNGGHPCLVREHYRSIVATSDHPFFRGSDSEGPEKWVKAGELYKGDHLLAPGDQRIAVSRVCEFSLGLPLVVYNIQVENQPEFFANGILVHNCPLCQPLEGVIMSIKEARGIIPRHTQCRCAFLPSNLGEDQSEQIRTKAGIQGAFDKSFKAEMPKFRMKVKTPPASTPTGRPVRVRAGKNKTTIAQQRRKSKWSGADVKVRKAPKGILDELATKRTTPEVPKSLFDDD